MSDASQSTGMTSAEGIDTRLLAFVQSMIGEYLPYEKFLACAESLGLDGQKAWRLITYARRVTGFPRLPLDGERAVSGDSFWTMPPVIFEAIEVISSRASAASHLWSVIEPLAHRRQFLQPIVEDIAAAAIRDGFSIGYEEARRIIVDGATPCTNTETIIAHTWEVMQHIPPEGAFWHADDFARALRHITSDASELPDTAASAVNPITWLLDRDNHPHDDELLESSRLWGTHPLFNLLMQSEMLWSQQHFPACNTLLEVAARTSSARAMGLPLLQLVPLSQLRFNWEHGIASGALPDFPYGRAVLMTEFGTDCTPSLLQDVSMIVASLDGLERTARAMERTLTEANERIGADFRLNHRQQDLLRSLLANPALAMDVETYRRRFDVALTTARDDLNRLVALQWCTTAYEGKRQVFWLSPSADPLR